MNKFYFALIRKFYFALIRTSFAADRAGRETATVCMYAALSCLSEPL